MGISELVGRPRPIVAEGRNRVWVVAAQPGPEFTAALNVRRRVFDTEQGMVDGGLTDRDDGRSLIALAIGHDERGEQAVGTGRLTLEFGERREALIAWVATLPEARERGVGTAVMRFLLAAADAAVPPRIVLAAQMHAEGFYRRFGFMPAGERYLVKGIPHRWMARSVERRPAGRAAGMRSLVGEQGGGGR